MRPCQGRRAGGPAFPDVGKGAARPSRRRQPLISECQLVCAFLLLTSKKDRFGSNDQINELVFCARPVASKPETPQGDLKGLARPGRSALFGLPE